MLTKRDMLKDFINCPRALCDFYFEASCNWSAKNVQKIRLELRKAMAQEQVRQFIDNMIIKYNLFTEEKNLAFYEFIKCKFEAEYDRELIDTINSMHNKHKLIGWLSIVRCFIDSNFPVTFDKPLTRGRIKSLYKNDDTDYFLYKYQKQEHLEYFHNLIILHCRRLLGLIRYAELDKKGKEKVKLIFEGASKTLVRREHYSSRGIEIKCELTFAFVIPIIGKMQERQVLMSENFMFECKSAIEYFQKNM